jgi:multiple sugar transport system permease protein
MNRRKEPIFRLTLLIVAFLAALPFLLPFLWLLATAFKPTAQIMSPRMALFPDPITFEHFRRVFEEFPFFIYLRNTVLVTLGTVLGTLFSSISVAYALSHLEWPDRKLTFSLLMVTMMLPPQVTMIPIFLIFRQLGWIDTFLPLIVPAFLGNAFFVFLLRQFFLGFPRALVEAARIDGASEPRILFSIILPLCRPAILTVILFSTMMAWNDFVSPLIYLSSESKKTLALGLQSLIGRYVNEWGMLMAASFVMALPMILLFFAAQKKFIQGIALSGMKG